MLRLGAKSRFGDEESVKDVEWTRHQQRWRGDPLNSETTKPHRVPLMRFFITTVGQLTLAVLLFAFLFPNRFRTESLEPWTVLLWVALFGAPLSLFEYLYHRYLLHSAVLPFMGSMFRAHVTHHKLTDVKAPVRSAKPDLLVPVINEYSIETAEQEESMMFPAYSVSIFYGIFLILIGIPAYLLFAGSPIFLSLLIAVTLYYSGYELWHAALHLPYERFWQPLIDGRRTRRLARVTYSFHLMHHWRPTCNLAVVGFWGIAVWDHAFRTHRRPGRLPLVGAEVSYEDGELRRPLWPIRLLDKWKGNMYHNSRRLEKFLAKVFLRKSYNS